MRHARGTGRFLAGLLLAMGLVFAGADTAYAQANGNAGHFSCYGGRAAGSLYVSGASCPTTISGDHVFSYFICNMEQLSSDLMGNMYCGMMNDLIPAILGVLTLAVLIFGISFTIGLVPATARDFQAFLLKLAFIAAFATQSDLLVGYGYQFLVSGLREGVAIALSGLDTSPGAHAADGAQLYGYLDAFLGKIIGFATDYIGIDKTDPSKAGEFCKNALFSVMAIMAVAFPPVFYMGLIIILKIGLTFLRAVFGYIYSIVGIAFLLTLSPFFLTFYLFRPTRPFFDKWLGYLVSFALQMVILFSFLVFILSIDVSNISSSLPNIIMPTQETHEGKSYRMPWEYCTLCDFEVINTATGTAIDAKQYKDFVGQGKLQCKTPKKPIKLLFATSPGGGDGTGPPNTDIQNALMKFTSGLLSLLVLAYLIDAMLRYAASLSQSLASGMGATYAPQIGGGESPRQLATLDVPGFGKKSPNERSIMDQFGDNFDGSAQSGTGFMSQKDSLSGTAHGLKNAMSILVTGKNEKGVEVREGSASNNLLEWLTDPNRIDIR